MSFLKRSNCAPHYGDDSGNTYDSKGKVCGGLSSDDKLYIALGGGLCGAIVIGLAITYLIRRRNQSRSRKQESNSLDTPEMYQTSHAHAPLLGWGSQYLRRPQNGGSLDLSRMTSHSPSMASSSYHDPHSPVPSSPYSVNSEVFHFPILSADGHLLPPAPASAARSPSLLGPVLSSERPLPSPPLEQVSGFLSVPGRKTGSYAPLSGNEEEPAVIGLWPGQGYSGNSGYSAADAEAEADIGQMGFRAGRSVGLSPIIESPASRATPRLTQAMGYPRPHSAVIYDSGTPSYTYDERGALVRDYR